MYYNRWAPPPDELYHFGVKGMRWGVRHERIATHRRTRTTFGANMQDRSLDKKHRIPKGTKMYRTTTNADESNSGSTYVSYQDADRKYYKAWVTSNTPQSKPVYEKTFELAEDLLIPSRDEVKEAYQEAVLKLGQKTVEEASKQFIIAPQVEGGDLKKAEKDYAFYRKVEDGEKVSDKDWKKYSYINGQHYENAFYTYNRILSANRDKYISDFALGMGTLYKNPKVKEQMIKTLSAKGYNAIVDEAGVGSLSFNGKTSAREGQETLILFDRSKTLKEVKSEEIPSSYNYLKDVNTSQEALKKMRARKAI